MILHSVPPALVSAFAAFACLYAPGLALVHRSDLPLAFARVLASTIVTTLVATGLAAAGTFTLPHLLAANAAATVAAFLLRLALADGDDSGAPRDLAGPLILVVALAAYWPGYPTFLGSGDATAYVGSGISLAHHGTLSRSDEVGPTLPASLRPLLFDSMSQVFESKGPPFRRMPGAMLLESLDSTTAWPCFFPVPSVWAAVFVVAHAPGGSSDEEGATGFAPLFAALALWAYWILARSWLGGGFGLVAVLLLGASAPFYQVANMTMSEPIAAFFSLGALAVLASSGAAPRRTDALLAGAAFGAAVFTRVEIAMLLAMAFALSPSIGSVDGRTRRVPPLFVASFLAVASMVLVQAALVPGSYLSPLVDHAKNAWIFFQLTWGTRTLPAFAAAGLLGFATSVRLLGLSRTLRWGCFAGVLVGHAAASRWLWDRTPMWLSFSIGWEGMLLAALGAWAAWRSRFSLPAAPFVLALAASVAAILFYNPHVLPTLPWGARRFVPLLLPLLLMLACHAIAVAATRSRLLAFVFLAALGWEVAAGGMPLWRTPLLEGSWNQLAAIDEALPQGGVVFYDRDISPMMVGPAMWLIHDRNGVAVPPSGSRAGREFLPALVAHYAPTGPVYLVTRGAGQQVRTPRVRFELLGRAVTDLRLLEQAYDHRPKRIERYLMPIAVYRLWTSDDPRGAPVP